MDLSNEVVIHRKEKGMEYLQFRRLLEFKELNHAYSLGLDRNYRTATVKKEPLKKEIYEKAIQDYGQLCQALGSEVNHLVKTNQNHTDEVKVVTSKILKDQPDFNLEKYQQTDGMITNQKQMMLSTTNADCILLLFYDPVKKVIANTHSGWRGTLQRISCKTIEKMVKEFQCKKEDIIVCICPSIRKCHFEVGKEVKELFEKEFQEIEKIQNVIKETKKNEKWNIDTVYLNQIILQEQGLQKENIIDSGICSICHCDQIHSYRTEKEGYGLNTAVIELVK